MKKFFSKIAQRAFALAISIMVVTNTFAQGAAGIDAASSELANEKKNSNTILQKIYSAKG